MVRHNNKKLLSKLTIITEDLKTQTSLIDYESRNLPASMLLTTDCFINTLFQQKSEYLSSYVQEVRVNIAKLDELMSDLNKNDRCELLIKVIEQQILALITAINARTTQLKIAKQQCQIQNRYFQKKAAQSFMQSSHALYQNLAETHEFERRLMVMLEEKQKALLTAPTKKQQTLSEQILTLHQRLGRCRQAISKIEHQIELSEKR